MQSYPRLITQFAATIATVATLSRAAPATAADSAVPAREAAAATTNATPSVVRRHASRETRIAGSHGDRRVSPIRSNPDCSGVWCRRQFVLIVGVAY